MTRNQGARNPLGMLLGAAGLVAVLTLVSRLFGFARWLGQATWVGADFVGNAYASANQIPNVIFEVVVGGALASITVPLLAKAISAELRDEINSTASALFTWTLTLLVPLGIVLFLGADVIAGWLPVSVGSDAAAQNMLAAMFLRIFSPQIPLYGVAVVLGGVLQAHHRFAWPAIMPALSSVVIITAYAVYGSLAAANPRDFAALQVLGWGTTLGAVALSIPLFIPVHQLGIRLRLTWKMPREQFLKALELGAYGIGALLAAQGYMLATLFLTRWGGVVGTINVFQYAQAIYMLPYALFTFPVATVVFPLLTKQFAAREEAEVRRLATSSTALVAGLSMLGVAGLVAIAPAMAAIFSWNKPIPGLQTAILAMAPALVGYALLYHLSRVFIATDHAKHSFWAAVVGWTVAAAGGWLLIVILAPGRGDGINTLLALGLGNAIGMSAAGLYLLVAWHVHHQGAPLQILAAIGICLPGTAIGAWGGFKIYALLMSLSLPAGLLWATLAAGTVSVVCCVPGLMYAAKPFVRQTRQARQPNPGTSGEA